MPEVMTGPEIRRALERIRQQQVELDKEAERLAAECPHEWLTRNTYCESREYWQQCVYCGTVRI